MDNNVCILLSKSVKNKNLPLAGLLNKTLYLCKEEITMKNAIHEYLDYSDTEKKELWKTATFIFDTNVFLNLYRYSKKTRDIMFKAFEDLADRIWMPNHVAHEIMNNRCEVIVEANDRYEAINSDISSFVKRCKDGLRLADDEREIIDLKKYLDDWLKENQKKNQIVKNFSNDAVLEKLLSIFDGKVGASLSDEEIMRIKEEGAKRFEKQVPPGYKDYSKTKGTVENNAFGDLIVWKEILKYSSENKKDIIYVTNDKKEDWWYIVKGKTVGPRIELKKEFEKETSRRFHMYTMLNFIDIYDDSSDSKMEKITKNEIELFSRIILRRGTKQELKDYYDSLEDDESRRIAKTNFKIMRLEKKNTKRRNQVERIQSAHTDWAENEELSQLVKNNEFKIEKDSKQIEMLRQKINRMQ